MRSTNARILKAALAATALLAAGIAGAATTAVNLTAQRMTATLPDGATVPMWGYCTDDAPTSANTALGGGTLLGANACTVPTSVPNTSVANTKWAAGPTIVVPYGNSLSITLTNGLPTPTSIVILGQVMGGGLGSPTKIAGPDHPGRTTTTWPANADGGFSPLNDHALRVMSFGTQVANGAAPATLSWPDTNVTATLAPGTYLYEAGTHPSIQVPMGLYGVLVVTCAPGTAGAGQAYPSGACASSTASAATVAYDIDQVLLFSEADAVQNAAVDGAVVAAGCLPLVGACTATLDESKYPAAVNYAPTYFFVNGKTYDPTFPASTQYALNPPPINLMSAGAVLLRLVNAGSRTHVPSVVGLPMTIAAEDGHRVPGAARIQNEVLLSAGKVHDVLVRPVGNNGRWLTRSFAFFDRELSLSTNNLPNGGLQGALFIGSAAVPAAVASCTLPSPTYTVPYGSTTYSGSLLQGLIGFTNVALPANVVNASLMLGTDGAFTYTLASPAVVPGPVASFSYTAACTNGASPLSPGVVTLVAPAAGTAPLLADRTFNATNAVAITVPTGSGLQINPATNLPYTFGYPVTFSQDLAYTPGSGATACPTVVVNPDGSFLAATTPSVSGSSCVFGFKAVSSQGIASAATATATIVFPTPNGPTVTVVDAQSKQPISDYRWLIEEDRTFHTPVGTTPTVLGQELGSNFHVSHMPVVAAGCTGPKSCREAGSGYQQGISSAALNPATGVAFTPAPVEPEVTPDQVALDPSKYYFISVLTGDAADAFAAANTSADCQGAQHASTDCGHQVAGAPIPALTAGNVFAPVTVRAEPTPQVPSQISVFIYEDIQPINGAPDGEEETLGLGGFEVIVIDPAGRNGDVAGQTTYDVNNMPLTNALIDTYGWVVNTDNATDTDQPGQWINLCPSKDLPAPADGVQPDGQTLVGMIYTCPDGSQLVGQALVKNLEPGRYDVVIRPGAARFAKGEVWVQTETLEGTPAQDAFAKVNEPTYFQEFGPPGPHTTVGFANKSHVDAYRASLGITTPTHAVTGRITNLHMSRPSDVRLYDSGSREPLAHTTCWVALNSSGGTGMAIGMESCDTNGNFTISGIPDGQYQLAYWDEWLDQIISFKSVTVSGGDVALGDIGAFSWFTRVETTQFLDVAGNHTPPSLDGTGRNTGISNIPVVIRYRDGSISSRLATDSSGGASFVELFPLFNWYVIESDSTRYKSTGVDVWVDAGGPVDTAGPYSGVLTSHYVGGASTHRWDDASLWATNPFLNGTQTMETEGIQGFVSQTVVLNWAKVPYGPNENGGITGVVAYASTRAFDDPRTFVQNIWEPLVPNVTVNLYKEVMAPDGVTPTLTFLASTKTSSWDDAVHATVNGVPNGTPLMSCPGMNPLDPFVAYTLGSTNISKCFDGFRAFNQAQPAPYNGRYNFSGLQPGKYVVEMVPPVGYEVVKEEDKNILVGDAWVAPAAEQFAGLGNIYILPDMATLNNANLANPGQNNPTTNNGTDRADIAHPPCVGSLHQVPDYLALFPNVAQVAPFAGAVKPLCDRKEVIVENQAQSNADFAVFTNVPIAAHFTGMILDDAASEFNPASPAFGEKFAVPFSPIAIRDWNGVEISRMHSDQWGMYNGLAPSSWEVNVPNPAGYSPNMLITCMNDPGPISTQGPNGVQQTVDPYYNRMYSNFCYTLPFMPGLTSYLDTPVVPTAAFADGYEPVDCEYPNYTPAIGRVDGNWVPSNAPSTVTGGIGPYLLKNGKSSSMTLTITSLGVTNVLNPAYVGPQSQTAPYNAKMISRDYSFGATPGKVFLGTTDVSSCATWATSVITLDFSTCAVPANGTYELSITAANGKSTFDAITVTVEDTMTPGWREPHYVPPGQSIQALVDGILDHTTGLADPNYPAGDATKVWPGDMIMLDAGAYEELVVLWMPVRLQGVGAPSTIINAAKFPTNKLDAWRKEVNLLFLGTTDPSVGTDTPQNPQVMPLPGQEIADAILAGEPVVLADAEGAGITVLGQPDCRVFDSPPLNQDATVNGGCPALMFGNQKFDANGNPMPGAANYMGNFSYRDPAHPARIDGLTVTGGDSGGGIFVDGWAQNLEIANNRIYGNAGVYAGGIRIGQPYLEDSYAGPLNYNMNVKIHNNAITTNGALESNTGNGGAGGGLSISSGADHYRVDHNFICGNNTEDDGGGVGHIGVSTDGQITHNWILFNESFNPTTTQSGGGIAIEGEPANNGGTDAGNDTIAPTYGSGDVLIDSNVIVGNFAKGGHGGGIWLLDVNGDDVAQAPATRSKWFRVTITNNYIANNVAAWSGGGIALQDTLNAVIDNNTIVRNDSTATAGAVFSTGAYTNYSPAPTVNASQSYYWPAGVSSQLHAAAMSSFLVAANVPTALQSTYSDPTMQNDVIWGNRAFYFTSNAPADTTGNPTYGLTTALVPTLTQTVTGGCAAGEVNWDVGVVGYGPTSSNAPQLHPEYSVLTSNVLGGAVPAYYSTNGNFTAAPDTTGLVTKAYCNGSRVPVGVPNENAQIPPFQMLATSAEDESGNFVDVHYGPLSLFDLVNGAAATDSITGLYGDYRLSLVPASVAIDAGTTPVATPNAASDYYGTARPQGAAYDLGAQEVVVGTAALLSVSPTNFGAGVVLLGNSVQRTITLRNVGAVSVDGIVIGSIAQGARTDYAFVNSPSSCGSSLAPGASCTLTVGFTPAGIGALGASFTVSSSASPNPLAIPLTGTGAVMTLTVTPGPLNFRTARGTTSAAQTITVTAPYGGNIGSVTKAPGGQGSRFNVTNNCPSALGIGGSCSITVTFTAPSGPGTSTTTLRISGGAQTLPNRTTVTLRGTST